MKKLLFILVIFGVAIISKAQDIPKPTKAPFFDSDKVPEGCMINGVSMNGKVKVINSFNNPTFRIKVANNGEGGEDLTVRFITNTRSSCDCGQWELVESGEDFTVAFVESGEDFIIRITEPY